MDFFRKLAIEKVKECPISAPMEDDIRDDNIHITECAIWYKTTDDCIFSDEELAISHQIKLLMEEVHDKD